MVKEERMFHLDYINDKFIFNSRKSEYASVPMQILLKEVELLTMLDKNDYNNLDGGKIIKVNKI